ncbi:hypothetical protein BASA81_006870 [Batrachochytrium salamandrivorans]|nr:hypothetical protein BASA81_006870 [Batrachochytrium salamandrivorans]
MLLQPCEGTQRVQQTSPGAFDLVNDSPNHCFVTSPDGHTFSVSPHETLSLPHPAAAATGAASGHAQRKVTFSVNRAGRTFTVYGELNTSASSPTSPNENLAITPPPAPRILSKKPLPVASSNSSQPALFSTEDSLLLSTENLINARLGHSLAREDLSAAGSKSPHAKLSALQTENSRKTKANIYQHGMETCLDTLRERIESEQLRVRQEASFDVGLKEQVWDLLHTSYEANWLGFALNELAGKASPTSTTKTKAFDVLFNNPALFTELNVKRQGAFPENIEFKWKSSRYAALQLLRLVLFLDVLKTNSPNLFPTCLFRVQQTQCKSSEQVLQQLATLVFYGEADLTRNLKKAGFQVLHKQMALEEYDTRIPCGRLVSKVRDGVLLSMLVESYTKHDVQSSALVSLLRIPAKERLHCITNNEKLLDQLNRLDPTLLDLGTGRVTKYDIVDGKQVRILELVWKIVLRFGLSSVVNDNLLWKEVRNAAWKHRNDLGWQTYMSQVDCNSSIPIVDQGNQAPRLQRLLLFWIQTVCASFATTITMPIVMDFSASLSDGSALCLLINYYHPTLLPLDQVFFNVNGSGSTGGGEGERESERMRLERRNFSLFNAALDAIGEVPVRLSSHHFKHPLPPQLGFSTLAFLASRMLGTTREVRAAQKIQTAWAVSRAKRLGTQDSAQKASKLVEQERLRAQSDQENGKFEGNAARNFFARLLSVSLSPSFKDQRQPQFDENKAPPPSTAASQRRQQQQKVASNNHQSKAQEYLLPPRESPFQEEQRKRQESARRAQIQFEAKQQQQTQERLWVEQAEANERAWEEERLRGEMETLRQREEQELQQQREWQQRVKQQQQGKWIANRRQVLDPNNSFTLQQQQLQQEEEEQLRAKQLQDDDEQALYEQEQALLEQRLQVEQEFELQLETEQAFELQLEQDRQATAYEKERRLQEEYAAAQEEEEQRQAMKARIAILETQKLEFENEFRRERHVREQLETSLMEERLAHLVNVQPLVAVAAAEEAKDESVVIDYSMQDWAKAQLAELLALRKSEETKILQLEREHEAVKASQELFALQSKQKQGMLAQEEDLLEQKIAMQHQFLEQERIRMDLESEHKLQEVERLEQLHRREVEELEHIRATKLAERRELEALEHIRKAKQRDLELVELNRKAKQEEQEAQRLIELEAAAESKLLLEQQVRLREMNRKALLLSSREPFVVLRRVQPLQQREVNHGDNDHRMHLLLDVLGNPTEYHLLNKRSSPLLWEKRDCMKMLVLALRKCKRSQCDELCMLLGFVLRSFTSKQNNHKAMHQDLLPHLVSAVIDVLQTFYDLDKVFDLALRVFARLCPQGIQGYEHRLLTLHELLETKLQIQRHCRNPPPALQAIAHNLERLRGQIL